MIPPASRLRLRVAAAVVAMAGSVLATGASAAAPTTARPQVPFTSLSTGPQHSPQVAAPWGTVLVPGSAWAGSYSTLGDLNVYSNGNGNQDQPGRFGLDYECVELAQRWAAIRFGEQRIWPVAYAYQMWNAAPSLSVPFNQFPNGGAMPPQFGDLLIFGPQPYDVAGHVAVVAGTGPGYVDVVEQNWDNSTGEARLPITGNTMPSRWGLPVLGWLRASTSPVVSAVPPGRRVAITGPDTAMWSSLGGQGLSSLGGQLLASPAVAAVPASVSTQMARPLYVGLGVDDHLWVRDERTAWQPLTATGTTPVPCQDAPAATVSGGAAQLTLTVACEGQTDQALWYGQTTLVPGTLPTISAWTSLGGTLTAGPAVAQLGGALTFLVVGSGGQLSTRTLTGTWTPILPSLACSGHPALTTAGSTAWLACQNQTDHSLAYATATGSGPWSAPQSAGGQLLDGPGIAPGAGQATFYVEGVDQAVWEETVTLGGPAPTGFTSDGWVTTFGPSAVTLSTLPVAVAVVQNGGPMDGSLWTARGPSGFISQGGVLISSAAIASIPGTDPLLPGTPLYLGTGGDHTLWIRSDTLGWQQLSPSAQPYCLDNPAAVVTGTAAAATMTVVCEGRDHAVWMTSGPVTTSALPALNAWSPLGGAVLAGPALTAVAGVPTVFAVGLDHAIWTRTPSTAWTPVPSLSCQNHPAAGASTSVTYLACTGVDGALWYTMNTGSGWSTPQSAGGVLVGGPAVSAMPGEAIVQVEGSDGAVWETALQSGLPPTPWLRDGWSVRYGTGGTAL